MADLKSELTVHVHWCKFLICKLQKAITHYMHLSCSNSIQFCFKKNFIFYVTGKGMSEYNWTVLIVISQLLQSNLGT